jgi:DNA-binding LacI/PurR family transcriptional regulator
MLDVRVDDPRIAELLRLGLPAVVIGGPLEGGVLPAVWHDEKSVVTEAVRYLAALGHERIAHVAGVSHFVHTTERIAAFRAAMDELGLRPELATTDYTPESGARVTRRLLSSPEPPTAIIFDSDLLAVTGLGVAQQMSFVVPDDVSIVGWDDSLISQVVHPPLTAITRDIAGFGVLATRHLLAVIDGTESGDVEAPRGDLTPRGSTGRPKAARAARG